MRHERVRAGDRRPPTKPFAAGTCRGSSFPSLDDPRLGPFEGAPLDDYREWASGASSSDTPGGDGESRFRSSAVTPAAYGEVLQRPEETILVVAHSLPIAYALAVRDGQRAGLARPARRECDPVPVGRSRAGGRGRRARALARGPDVLTHTTVMSALERIEDHIRRHELIEPGGEVLCLVSGGADSTCLVLALRELGYRVGALHVDHGLRGRRVGRGRPLLRRGARRRGRRAPPATGSARRRCATSATPSAPERLRATGHTASDQVETILYRLVTSGNAKGIKPRREDGVVRPLLPLWREETRRVLPRARARAPRRLLERGDDARADPRPDPAAARADPSRRAREHPPRARDRAARCRRHSPSCSTRRPHRGASTSAAASRPCASTTGSGSSRARSISTARCCCGGWRIRSELPGLMVRGWRPGDRLAGRIEEDPGRVRRRQDPPLRPRRLAARRPRRRSRRRAGYRRGARRGGGARERHA